MHQADLIEPWHIKIGNTPIWYYLRSSIVASPINSPKQKLRVRIWDIILSPFLTLWFLIWRQWKTETVVFSLDRQDCTDFYYNLNKHQSCLLFLNRESTENTSKEYFATCDFLNAIRLGFRLTARLHKKQISEFALQFKKLGYDLSDHQIKLIASCIGDYYFNHFLALILSKGINVYYVGAVVPQTEKFENLLNSSEIQHGVIHANHYNYSKVPNIKNGLVVYHEKYLQILKEIGYSGRAEAIPFKDIHQHNNDNILVEVVLYTQPSFWPEPTIKNLFQQLVAKGVNVKIKKHPRDYDSYNLDASAFINKINPNNVLLPVVYNSTIAEDFLILKKDIVVFDPNKTLNLHTDSCFRTYSQFQDDSKIFYSSDINDLIATIERYLALKKRA